MRRRRLPITLIGSAAVWPAAAIAQQNNEKRLVGIITGFNDKEIAPIYAAFRTRLRELDRRSKRCFGSQSHKWRLRKTGNGSRQPDRGLTRYHRCPGNSEPHRRKTIYQNHTGRFHPCFQILSASD